MKKAIVLIVSVLALVLPAGVGAKGKTFTVGESVVKWTTPEKYKRSEQAIVGFRYRGRDVSGEVVRADCVLEFSGYGFTARVWACDNGSDPSPLRVRIASSREKPAKIRFVYFLR